MIDTDYGYGFFGFKPGSEPQTHACNCVGPKNGQPRCPCMMRSMTVKDGRWVQIIDHGPVDSDTAARIRIRGKA